MRIVLNFGTASNGDDKEYIPTGLRDTLQFSYRLQIALGVKRIAITFETNMLHNMHAGQRLHAVVRKAEIQQVAMPTGQTGQRYFSRAIVIKIQGADGRSHADKPQTGAHVNVLGGSGLRKDPCRPCRMIQIMGVKRRRTGRIIQAWPPIFPFTVEPIVCESVCDLMEFF